MHANTSNDIHPTPFRYLDAQYVHEKYARPSVQTDGGHRGDSVPVCVPVLDARPTRPTQPLLIAQQLDSQGHCLVDFTASEMKDVAPLRIKAMEHDRSLQQSYFSVCERLALRATGASFARAFNFTLRDSRIKGIHTKPTNDNSARGPVNDVHTDYTDQSPGVHSIRQLLYTKMKLGSEVRFCLYNVWRNISEHPIETWPLAVCNATSVKPHELIERISPENNNVIHNVLPNASTHEWRYYSKMQKNECLVFKQYDTDQKRARFVPHTAFDLVNSKQHGERGHTRSGAEVPPRESCEVRVLLVFDEEGVYRNQLQQAAAASHGTYQSRVAAADSAGGSKSKL